MNRAKPLLVSKYEIETDAALREVAERRDVRVCPKVRVADAVKIAGSGLSADEYGYALRAHFDFLVVRDAEGAPEFAVEFDGPKHDTDPDAILRDRHKGTICKKFGLPLLRIDAGFLRRVNNQNTLLGWLIELWYTYNAFNQAQQEGRVPFDEPFCYFSLYEIQPGGRLGEVALDGRARRFLMAAERRRICSAPVPEEVSRWPGPDSDYAESYAILPVPRGLYIFGYARCRMFDFDAGIHPRELACDLAVVDLAEKLQAYCRSERQSVDAEGFKAFRERTKGWLREGMLLSDLPSP